MLESINSNKLEYQKLSQEEMQKRGILGRLVGVCADIISPTRNGRKYPEELWEKVFASPLMKERIDNRVAYGELGHPADREETDMEKVAVCLAEVPKKGKDGKLRAVFDILNTPNGQILKSLCDYGSILGISSRGSGDLVTDWDGQESVDPDTYNCEGFDIVLLPAVKEARLQYVNESLDKTRYRKTLRSKLQESLDKASESDRKIMEESLYTLGIELNEGYIDGFGEMPDHEVIDGVVTQVSDKDSDFEDSFYDPDLGEDEPVALLDESLRAATPYMVRNDGAYIDCAPMHPYIKSYPNGSLEKNLDNLFDTYGFSLDWYYNNTLLEDTKNYLKSFVKSLVECPETVNYIDAVNKWVTFDYDTDKFTSDKLELKTIYDFLNDSTNQEFCRARVSDMVFGGTSGDIYFRISSTGFDWFDIIYKIVAENKDFITSVTICKDGASLGGGNEIYSHKGQAFDHMPIDEFLTLSGNPIIEKLNTTCELDEQAVNVLARGGSLSEAYAGMHPRNARAYFTHLQEDYVKNYFTNTLNESLKSATPYMLRNDGVCLECGDTHPYIADVCQQDLYEDNVDEFNWFYQNTKQEKVKQLLKSYVKSIIDNPEFDDYNAEDFKDIVFDYSEGSINDPCKIAKELINLTNQEFCRVRTSDMSYGNSDPGAIYFRISSKNFNWFDIIYKFVANNKNSIENITISNDDTFSDTPEIYSHKGQDFDHMPVDEFLTLSGNPVVENIEEKSSDAIRIPGVDDKVFIIPDGRVGYVISKPDKDHCEVETIDGAEVNMPDRIDVYYTSDLEVIEDNSSINELEENCSYKGQEISQESNKFIVGDKKFNSLKNAKLWIDMTESFNKNMPVAQLEQDKQVEIYDELMSLGLEDEDIEKGMNGKISDLEDTINIKPYLNEEQVGRDDNIPDKTPEQVLNPVVDTNNDQSDMIIVEDLEVVDQAREKLVDILRDWYSTYIAPRNHNDVKDWINDGCDDLFFKFINYLVPDPKLVKEDIDTLNDTEQYAADSALSYMRKHPDADMNDVVYDSCKTYNDANVELEYEDEDFYTEEADYNKVLKYVKAHFNNIEKDVNAVVNNEATDIVESLARMHTLEEEVTDLQEKLSVGYAKELQLTEELEAYKAKVNKLSDSNKKARKLSEQLSASAQAESRLTESLNEQAVIVEKLEQANHIKDSQIKELSEKLTKVTREKKQEIISNKELTENYETSQKDLTQLKEQYSKKLNEQNQTIEKYQRIARKAIDKYIDNEATRLGVKSVEIKNRLPENYSFKDIDKVCESLREYKLNVSTLPFSTNSMLNENIGLKVKNVNKGLTPSNPIDEITDYDLKLIEAFK